MKKSQQELESKFKELRSAGTEHEWLDFKSAEKSFDTDKLGKYFSALSNEANLANERSGWLVLGVDDKTRVIKGTTYLHSLEAQASIKATIASGLNTQTSFIEIHEYLAPEGRVLMLEIPAGPKNIPVEWKRHGWAREGESIVPLPTLKRERIRKQKPEDWSALKCEEVSYESDLDDESVSFLRKKVSELKKDDSYLTMPLFNLLNRFGLLTDDVPNNTCVLFLAKTEVAKRLHPEVYKITWKYEDVANGIALRHIFEAPLIAKLEPLQDEIDRFNTQLSDLELFRRDVKQYDKGSIEELLINSLVHRDWTIDLWNEVHQTPLQIRFTNHGIFHADLMMALIENHRPPYANPTMADFLQHVNLMEREGGGLRRVYISQLRRGVRVVPRFLNEIDPPRVDFVLKGKVENIDFAKLVLATENEIELSDLLVLDKVIGGKNRVGEDIPSEDADRLKQLGYLEIRGRKFRKCYVSAALSDSLGKRGEYVRQKGFNKDQKIAMILNLFDQYPQVKTSDIYNLFPEDSQSTLRNIMSDLVRRELIKRIEAPGGKSQWYYIKNTRFDDDF